MFNHFREPYRRRFDLRMHVTRTAGDRRKEGARHIKTQSPSHGRKPGQRGVNGVWLVGYVKVPARENQLSGDSLRLRRSNARSSRAERGAVLLPIPS